MKFVFKNLSARTDKDKAIPVLEHVYQPLEDFPEIKVRCSYLKAGESAEYMSTSQTGRAVMDFRALFQSHVKCIEGLEVEFADGKTRRSSEAEEFLALPSTDGISDILTNTCTHLLKGDALTEEEVKN